MKKILFILIMLLATTIQAQVFYAPSSKITFTDSTTSYKYVVDNKTYNVYISKKGAYYIWKVSKKTGKLYKMYLPKEIQSKMGRKY